MSLIKKAVSGGLWMASLSYVSFAINFIGQLILARLLFPADFGLFALSMSISEILFMLVGFGLSMACIQLQDEPEVYDTALIVSIGVALVMAVVGGAVSLWASFYYSRKVVLFLLIICLVKILQFPASIYSSSMEKDLLFKRVALITGITSSSAIIITIGLAYWGMGAWSLLSREILANTLLFTGMVLFSNYRFTRKFNKKTALKLWRFSYNMLFLRISEVSFQHLPTFLLGSLVGTRFVGLFERSLYVTGLPNRMASPFIATVAYPVYAKVKEDNAKIAEGLYWSLTFLSRSLPLLGLLVFLFPEALLSTILGEKWIPAAPIFRGFSLLLIVSPIFSVLKHALLAKGYVSDTTIGQIFSILFVVGWFGIAFYLHDIWNYVALAMGLGCLLGTIWLAWRVKKVGICINWFSILTFPVLLSVASFILATYFHGIDVRPALSIGIICTVWGVTVASYDFSKITWLCHRIKG